MEDEEELKTSESTVECVAIMDSVEPSANLVHGEEREKLLSEDEPVGAGGDAGGVLENRLAADAEFDGSVGNSVAVEKIELLAEATDQAMAEETIEKPIFPDSPTIVPEESVLAEGSSEGTHQRSVKPELESKGEKAEMEIDDAKEDMSGMQYVEELDGPPLNVSDDSYSLKNYNEAMVGVNRSCDENFDRGIESSEKPSSTHEGFVVHESDVTLKLPVTTVNSSSLMVTEETTCVVTGSEQVQDHKPSVDMESVGGDATIVSPEDKFVTKDDEHIELLKGSNLDNNVNAVETNEAALKKEELSSLDIKTEARTDATMMEIQSTDAKVETDLGSEMVSNGMIDDDGKMETGETASDLDEPGQEIYESAIAIQDQEDEAMAEEGTQDTEMETEMDVVDSGKASGGKRKRGKFNKTTSLSKPFVKSHSRKTVGEDVCFICFDGGELVLCDRRGCPKAYHPSCVNRDEAFFQSKGRWNCGWHLCSICEKDARYMCYTCTFSLCKSCTKESDIFCVRGSKGFCETCMRTVALIESNKQDSENDEVDFDDKNSWEYLFKDYFTNLKSKLSLSASEISEAKNPRKGAMTGPSKQDSSEGQADIHDGGSGSEDSPVKIEPLKPKSKKVKKISKSVTKQENLVRSAVTSGNADWASKELLDFVSHMKNGDTSVVSQFDVQALLLDYIKRNKLRDPRRKSQIVCDARLESLFGKPRVGHFEMLKLLESHFLLRDEQTDDVQSSVVDTENDLLETDGKTDTQQKSSKDKKRKSRKKGGKDQSNLDDFAAIDLHNIGLIYLRRKLMEDLLEEGETLHEKVIGTFVRIRISVSNQKQDMYRLVQVVGTSKASEPYKVGKKTTDITLEILNLNKTEKTSMDTISNQDFTLEECKRLRQSVKCGLIEPLTVGVILDKAMELQSIRVNDWLESEVLRLSHLRDRASDLGRQKELRECVQKLQLLKTPEERRRRLEEIPDVHADPKMDPSYESEGNDSDAENTQREAYMRSMGSGSGRRERGGFSSPRGEHPGKDSWDHSGNASSLRNLDSGRNPSISASINAGRNDEMAYRNSVSVVREKETYRSDMFGKMSSVATPEPSESALRGVSRSGSAPAPAPASASASISPGTEEKTKINESEKIWHYLDPSSKVQGPFSMVQLRKWNNTGYFPADLRIWRATEKQENAILLTDALAGKFSSTDKSSSHSLVDRGFEKLNRAGADVVLIPNPRQNNVSLTAEDGVLLSTPVLPNMGAQSPNPGSTLTPVIQTASFSPTPSSNPVILDNSAVSQPTQSFPANDVQMPVPSVQPVQTAITPPNLQVENQAWGSSAAITPPNLQVENQVWGSGVQPVQPQPQPQEGYNWAAPNVQNPSGVQPDAWGTANLVNQQQAMPTNTMQNAAWGPENTNVSGWGPMQGWGNPAPVNTNMNWAPPGGNATPAGWVPPGANMQQGMVNQGWAPNQGWVMPGNGWGPPSGPPPVQPPPPAPHGNANQGWGPRGQGSWGGDQNHGGGQRGGRPWDWTSRPKRETVCPYNKNGLCIKGSRCDYLHV